MSLIIIVSYAAFNAHAATHTAGDLGGCEVCAGYGDPSHAIPPLPGMLNVPTSGYSEANFESATQSASLLFHFHQRAPPNLS